MCIVLLGRLAPPGQFAGLTVGARNFLVGPQSGILPISLCLGSGSLSKISLRSTNEVGVESVSTIVFSMGCFSLRNIGWL